MKEVILLKFGEMALKGLNRSMFEALLLKDIRGRLKSCGAFDIYTMQSTVYIEPCNTDSDIDEAYRKIKKIFGIASVMRACEVDKDIETIKSSAAEYLKNELELAKSFKVEAKRSDKRFALTSPEIMREVGGYLLTRFGNLNVDVRSPELTVTVEIREKSAYIHKNAEAGAGGMPTGSNGRAAVLISGGIDSPVAAYMVAKRGVSLEAIHFFSYPYTSERAKQKVIDLLRIVSGYCGTIKTHIVPFTEIQEEIRAKCDEEYFTLVMRRFMMKISERIALNNNLSGLITGESIGQVASQTILALGVTDNAVNMPVFRPVIGMDKEEIVTIARKIGTFETSILPYEDCCTVFTPKHPKTRPVLSAVIEQEERLDMERLINKAIDGIETVNVY